MRMSEDVVGGYQEEDGNYRAHGDGQSLIDARRCLDSEQVQTRKQRGKKYGGHDIRQSGSKVASQLSG